MPGRRNMRCVINKPYYADDTANHVDSIRRQILSRKLYRIAETTYDLYLVSSVFIYY